MKYLLGRLVRFAGLLHRRAVRATVGFLAATVAVACIFALTGVVCWFIGAVVTMPFPQAADTPATEVALINALIGYFAIMLSMVGWHIVKAMSAVAEALRNLWGSTE